MNGSHGRRRLSGATHRRQIVVKSVGQRYGHKRGPARRHLSAKKNGSPLRRRCYCLDGDRDFVRPIEGRQETLFPKCNLFEFSIIKGYLLSLLRPPNSCGIVSLRLFSLVSNF
ncbi:hypothetical protein QTP88_008902 [Uroleucon formosanum]